MTSLLQGGVVYDPTSESNNDECHAHVTPNLATVAVETLPGSLLYLLLELRLSIRTMYRQ